MKSKILIAILTLGLGLTIATLTPTKTKAKFNSTPTKHEFLQSLPKYNTPHRTNKENGNYYVFPTSPAPSNGCANVYVGNNKNYQEITSNSYYRSYIHNKWYKVINDSETYDDYTHFTLSMKSDKNEEFVINHEFENLYYVDDLYFLIDHKHLSIIEESGDKIEKWEYSVDWFTTRHELRIFLHHTEDNEPPVITGTTEHPVVAGAVEYELNVDDAPMTIAQFQANLTIIDEYDGEISNTSDDCYIIKDTYTENAKKVGDWQIILEYRDMASNSAQVVINISVKDTTKPKLRLKNNNQELLFREVNYTEKLDLETLKNDLVATDNYDPSPQIVLISENYLANFNKIDVYQVQFQAVDSSSNKSEIETFKIAVIDKVPPIISGKNYYEVKTSHKNPLTEAEVRAGLTSIDEIDDVCSIDSISDTYTGNEKKPGDYQIVYQTVDASSNEATFTVSIRVEDDVPPVISGEDTYTVKTSETTPISEAQIREALSATDDVDGTVSVVLVSDEYTGNEKKPGEHQIVYESSDSIGNKATFTVVIQVRDNVKPVITTNDNFIQKGADEELTQEEIIEFLKKTNQMN